MRPALQIAQWVILSTTTAFHFGSSLVTEDSFSPATELTSRKVDIPVLRIMPLGGSITAGSGDEPKGKENGYRKPLRDEFRHRQHVVNMVGCGKLGSMKDNDHEGHPGALTEEIKGFAKCSINFKPNVVLINAGTNDAKQGGQVLFCPFLQRSFTPNSKKGPEFVNGTYERMKDIIEYLYTESYGVTVILSTLLPQTDSVGNANVRIINGRYRQLVSYLKSEGKKIYLAEMNDGFINAQDLADGTHPTHKSYPKIAAVWAYALGQALADGKVCQPLKISNVGKFADDEPV